MNNPSHVAARKPVSGDLPRYPSLVHMFNAAVQSEPELTAIVCEQTRVTYRQFGRAVAGLAQGLRQAGVSGGRVIVMMPNSIEADVAIMAVMSACAQVAPVNPFLTPAELEKVLVDVDACLLICDRSSQQKAEHIARELQIAQTLLLGPGGIDIERFANDATARPGEGSMPAADDLALLIFTGGSTGIPKGVDHTHRGLVWSCLQHCTVWPAELGKERFLNVAPMFHIWGLAYATWVPIYMRSTLVIVPRYEPDKVVQALAEHKITIFGGGPAPIYMGLLASPLFDGADLSALRHCLSGGAPCPQDLHREWSERAGRPLLEGWGMSEGAPFCLNPAEGQRKLLSVGNPVPETEIEVVDLQAGDAVLPRGEPGEVRVRGPQIMQGYRNQPEETERTLRDGWVYTGDIGYIDQDGFLFLVDRKKDMVIVGGYNVYPREVDEVLFNHPKIREAATVGKPDRRLGEVLVAFVVLDQGQTMDEQEFFAYCKDALVKYKRPVEVFFVDALPKTGTNKISRRALRERLSGR